MGIAGDHCLRYSAAFRFAAVGSAASLLAAFLPAVVLAAVGKVHRFSELAPGEQPMMIHRASGPKVAGLTRVEQISAPTSGAPHVVRTSVARPERSVPEAQRRRRLCGLEPRHLKSRVLPRG